MQEVDVREKLLASFEDICTATASKAEQRSLFYFSVPGEKAEEVWLRLREQVDASGLWPVILGTEDDCEEQVYAVNHPEELGHEAAEAIIKKGLVLNATEWLDERYNAQPDFFQTDEVKGGDDYSAFNAISKKYQFYTVMDLQKMYHPDINIALVPTRNSWEVPALLYYGGWNECPVPEAHVAMLRYWNEKHGAELFSMAGDVLELYVRHPPTEPAAALALAREQFIYCSDIVHQGTETLHALAEEIAGSHGWFFWWD